MDLELLIFFDDAGAQQLVTENGYFNADSPYIQPSEELFVDYGESDAQIIEEGYQQSDFIAPNAAQLPPEPEIDWSEPLADYQFNHFANVDQPSLGVSEEGWQDADVEHEFYWWTEENGYAAAIVQAARQEGDDDSILAMDDVGYDATLDIEHEDVTGADFTPPTTVTMPYLIGLLFIEAFSIVESIGLVMATPPVAENVVYPFAPEPAGTVIQQYPLPGVQVSLGSTVYVIVSSGLIVYPQGATVNSGNEPNVVIGDDTPP